MLANPSWCVCVNGTKTGGKYVCKLLASNRNVLADCFYAIHTHQLEFANTSLPTLVCRVKAAYDHKWWNRELTLKCKLKCYVKPMKDPLGVSPSKGNQGTTRGKEKITLTSVGIEPTTSGLDLPLLCRLRYEVGQRNRALTS